LRIAGSFKAKSGNTIAKRFQGVISATNSSVAQAIAEATLAIHAEAVRGIMKQSAGEKQTRYNPKRERVASKPGDPPNVDFGVFVKSVQFNVDLKNATGEVGTNDKRGPHFEFGTKNMAPRPWLTPAWRKAQAAVKRIFKQMKIKVAS
jgi:hypothetical protein